MVASGGAQEPRSVEQRDGAYWMAGWEWIAAERELRRVP
jgi:hypothetical protein